ncbi:MAG: DUF4838 domain-containing protein [Ruminococcaceae bacterium]|nr:DUF4838 domain-containing protein [Oscillospiraceae bacterium]
MKKLLSFTLASLVLLSVVSCGKTEPAKISSTASAGAEKYVTLFEERVDTMPDSLVLAMGADAAAYGVDVSAFADDEGYTVRAADGDVVILGKTSAGIDRGVRHFTVYGNYDNYNFTYGEDHKIKKLTVMDRPIENFAIVIPDDADDAMRYASEELEKYTCLATGVTLPVYTVSDYANDADAPSRKIELMIDYPTHGDEGFAIDVKDDGDIDIICGRYRGGIYGVYGLLRDMGWRFFLDGSEYVYESDLVNITEECDRTEASAIPNRYSTASAYNNRVGIHNGGYGMYGLVPKACHGLQSHKIDWQGSYPGFSGYDQPCYSDEGVLQAIEDHFRGYIEDRLAAGAVPGRDFCHIDVSQFDTAPSAFCGCRDCLEIMEEDGTQSGIVLRMTNRMADMAAEYSPEINALMLAYSGTNKPPKVTVPRDNVRIAYCFYIGADTGYICSNHNINDTDCPRNISYYEEFEGWKEICGEDTLQVWYYSFNCQEIACQIPCFDVAYGDIRYLTDSDIDCIMLCEEYNNDNILVTLMGELSRNGDITEEKYRDMVREYFGLYYGAGGEYVLECIDILQKSADMKGCFTNFDDRLKDKLDYSYIAANSEYIYGLFDKALKYAETEEIAEHIEVTKARIMYVCINATHESDYVNGTAEDRALFEERYTDMHRLFKKHSILVFDNYATKLYAPDEIDFTKTPTEHWCTR